MNFRIYTIMVVVAFSLMSQSAKSTELSAYEAMKSVYCYTYFNELLLKPKLIPEKVIISKEKSDILFPFYRDGVENLMKVASDDMVKSARTVSERKLNAIEEFMIYDACVGFANDLQTRNNK